MKDLLAGTPDIPRDAFVLVQRPPSPVYARLAPLLGNGNTVAMAHESRLSDSILSMVVLFENLEALPLPRPSDAQERVLGRSAQSGIVVHEPSVSSTHAALRWSPERGAWTIQDLDSRNGTFLNARRIATHQEMLLADGDALSFGDAQFLFLSMEGIAQQVKSYKARAQRP